MSDAPFSPPTPPGGPGAPPPAAGVDGASAEPAPPASEQRGLARRVAEAQARAQAAADASLFGEQAAAPVEVAYPGLVTRALALTVDALIVNGVAVLTAGAISLIIGMFNVSVPQELKTVVAALAALTYALWLLGYFVGFWASTGQTVGARVMQLRVVPAEDASARIKPRRALLRLVGLGVGLLAFGLGEAMMLLDDRRRTLQDRLARTLVVDAPVLSAHDVRRLEREGAQEVIDTSANARRP